MDNSKLVFCKIEDIDLMNEQLGFEEEECVYCLGTGSIHVDDEEYDCEYCEIIECSVNSDPEYEPNWSEDNDTEEDSDIDISDPDPDHSEECGATCNQFVCYCGSV